MPESAATPNPAYQAGLIATTNPSLTVYRPPVPDPVNPDEWAATHEPDDRFVAVCLDLGQPPTSLGMSKRRERVCVRAGLFFREYEWQEYDEPNLYYPWYLVESWRLPDGRKVGRKTEITEQLARDLIDHQGVRRGAR